MRVNIIPAIVAVAVATLLGLLAAYLCESSSNATVIGITTGASLAVILLPMLAVKSGNSRLDVNLRIVGTIFAAIVLLINFIVSLSTPEKLTIYFIILGLIILSYIGIVYSLVSRSS